MPRAYKEISGLLGDVKSYFFESVSNIYQRPGCVRPQYSQIGAIFDQSICNEFGSKSPQLSIYQI